MTTASAKDVLISADDNDEKEIVQITMTRQGSVVIELAKTTAADPGPAIDVSAYFASEDIEAVFAFVADRARENELLWQKK